MKRKMIYRILVCLILLTAILGVGTIAGSAKIWGYVYNDQNRNHKWDTGEPGIANWTMFLRGFTGAQATPLRTVTNDTGYYSFDVPQSGMYMLWEAEPNFCPDWAAVSPTLTVVFKTTTMPINFGNWKLTGSYPSFCNIRRV